MTDSPSATTASAGQQLRAQLDQALLRTGQENKVELLWDERELAHVEAAVAAADTAELIAQRLAEPEIEPATLVRLSAERRLQLKAVGDHVGALSIWTTTPKSERHVRAGQARWQQWHAKTPRSAQ